jgi:uncharacterized protein (DUF2141 family)
MIKYFLNVIYILSSYLLITSCASPSSPTGGPRDTIPPTMINSIPLNQSLNFKDKTIIMEFDERIKTDKIKDQLIITPLTESDYEYTIKKNTIKITFEEPFNDSTTYSLNFRESIQDLTEGNPTKDNKFTFSTGNYIDSMSINGYVKELLTYDTLKNVIIGLYKAKDTITIFNGSPYYFTEIQEDGSYLIENIKNGKYLLYAFVDDNKNLKLETNKEAYAFSKDTVFLDTGVYTRNLDLISLDLTDFKVMTALTSGKYFEINFNKYIIDYDITPINNNHTFYTSKAKENKSIRFYNNFNEIDSLQICFTAQDSINSIATDTLYIKFTESRRKPDDLIMEVTPKNKTSINPDFIAEIDFNKPIISYNIDSIFVRYDTTKISFVSDSTFEWSKHKDKLKFDVSINKAAIDTIEAQKLRLAEAKKDSVQNLPKDENIKKQINTQDRKSTPKINKGLQLYFGQGAFYTADNDTSASFGNNYTFIEPTAFGIQDVGVNTNYTNYCVQLVKENFEIESEVCNTKTFSIKNIVPGKYRIRVLIDANGDGVWSPGNMKKQIEPEPVYIYPEVIVIRADWQTSITLTF